MRAFHVGFVAVAVFLAVGSANGAVLEQVRLLSSTPQEVKAEILVPGPTVKVSSDHPGYQTISLGSLPQQGEPGEPSMPRVSFWVAIPPGSIATVSAEPVDARQWDGIRPLPVPKERWRGGTTSNPGIESASFDEDPTKYGGGGTWPRQIATLGDETHIRYQRIVPVIVSPARWNAATRTLTIASKIEVTITFSVAGKQRAVAPTREVMRDDPSWERTYDGMILNAAQARGWGRVSAAAPRPLVRGVVGPLAKLEVKTSGVKRITYADLPASFQGVSISDLWMYEVFNDTNDVRPDSTIEVPIAVVDADTSGTWTDGDEVYFFGQNLYDRRPDLPWYVKRYGSLHVYWLGVRQGGTNLRMAPTPSFLTQDPLPQVASYPWTEHLEKAEFTYDKPHTSYDDVNFRNGVPSVKAKHVYWQGGQPLNVNNADSTSVTNWYSEPFNLPGFVTGSTALGFAALFQGITIPSVGGDHRVYIGFTSGGFRERKNLPRMPFVVAVQDSGRYVASQADLLGMPLGETGNKLSHYEGASSYGAALDWFEVTYLRAPRFVQPTQDLTTWIPVQIAAGADTGNTEYDLTGTRSLTSDTMVGFETTDPRAPRVLTIDPAQVQRLSMRVQFRRDGTDRRYTIGVASSIPKPDGIVEVTGNDLLASLDKDYVIVIPRDWIPTIQPLIDHREAQGHRVLVAPIEDIYDQFSGGRHWPHAVRSFLRALFRAQTPGPSFLLLVGDASDVFDSPIMDPESDPSNPTPESAPNYVPTQTLFSDSFSDPGPELIATDQWFVDNLAPSGPGAGTGELLSFLPDMNVGRLPVGDTTQLQNVVAKILAYESFSPEDTWRNRGLFISDDQWSSGNTFTPTYCWNPSEQIFQTGTQEAIDLIRSEGSQCDFEIDPFFLACMMDTARTTPPGCAGPPNRCSILGSGCNCASYNGCDDGTNNNCYGSTVVRAKLVSEMSRGSLFVSYIGHSNAQLITHEYIFVDSPVLRHDIDDVGNLGKPFLFFGFGCHLNEFSSAGEALFRQGDAMTENLLMRTSDHGAIGTIGSTAYEWVTSSDQYEMSVFRSFFKNPPQFEGHSRWVLGEVFSGSKMDIVSESGGSRGLLSQSETYCLLGDPGLVMDGAPPRIATTLDGAPINNGDPLTMPADHDSITLAGSVCDQVWAKSLRIHDIHGDARPESIGTGDDRNYQFTYKTALYPRDYDIQLTADDGNGRTGSESFPVQVNAVFEIRKPAQDWAQLADGELVVQVDSLRVRVTVPRYIPSSDLVFLIDGSAAPTRDVAVDPVDGKARSWILTMLGSVPRGTAGVLSLKVTQPDNVDFALTHQVTTEPTMKIFALYNVPNPFKNDTAIFYTLGAPADNVTIRIYTTSGKLIRTLKDLPTRPTPGAPAAVWDGRDEDNDPVGNGLYFYKLIVKGADDQGKPTTITKIEKFARVR